MIILPTIGMFFLNLCSYVNLNYININDITNVHVNSRNLNIVIIFMTVILYSIKNQGIKLN